MIGNVIICAILTVFRPLVKSLKIPYKILKFSETKGAASEKKIFVSWEKFDKKDKTKDKIFPKSI